MARRPVYEETLVRADLDDLWRHTQEPDRHQRWDLRFTWIEYLPRADADAPQEFRYAVRLAPGVTVDGTGATVGDRHGAGGSRTSALVFGSDHPLSLIRSGSGYWRYVPTPDGIRFLTGYDYRPRWGTAGRLADALFRPVMGWGTAWSFDRLRLWLENGTPPETSLRRALLDVAGRLVAVGAAWMFAPWPVAALVTVAAFLAPPLPTTPAARRCRRRPPDRRSATPPAALPALRNRLPAPAPRRRPTPALRNRRPAHQDQTPLTPHRSTR
ncbi:hypothetical protein AB0M43_10485 [Longispora sp. NPDC051575]|uniref:hypothetical protein n=1 Tax=Longispora sp. NPDC051575 TaxID=3154943 RepID=UPI00341A7BD4